MSSDSSSGKGMRCFVTGASGYIGSYLVRRLLVDGHTVAVLLRPGSNRAPLMDFLSKVEIIEGSFDPATYREGFAAFAPEAVFHLGWNGTTAPERNGPHQISENVRAALDLLEIAHGSGTRVFLSTGSQAEYGRVSGVIREDQPLRPETAYGVAKAALSQLIPAYCQRAGMQSIWMRIFSVYGPGDLPIHMLPTLINGLLDRKRPALTAGGQQWDYLYIDDAVDAIATAPTVPGLSGCVQPGLREGVESAFHHRARARPHRSQPGSRPGRSALLTRPGDASGGRYRAHP